MKRIIRALPTLAALVVILAVAAMRAEPGHHAPVSGKGFLVFFGTYTVTHVVALALTRNMGQRRRRSRRASPYGY